MTTIGRLVFPLGLLVGCAPNSPSPPLDNDTGTVDGAVGTDSSTGFDVGPDDAGETTTRDGGCVGIESTATIVKRPIDFIVLPDESGSMGSTRDAVADAMQKEVKKALDAAGIDYKVIWHGSWPLPALAGKVTYNALLLGSGPSVMFKPVLDSFSSWSPALRADSLKVFVQFTDATSGDGGTIDGYAGMFDDAILAKSASLFGTSKDRKFTHHVFIGVKEKAPPTDPWVPTDAVVGVSCGSTYQAAGPLEELARRNQGFRFPLCRPDLFGGVFDRIAKTAIAGVSVPCELVIPEPPAGTKLDFATVAVRYKAGDGKVEVLLRAKDATECGPSRFLLDEATRRVSLCPEACARVKTDAKATISVLSGCDPKLY